MMLGMVSIVKSSQFSKGNIGYDVNFQKFSKIESLGNYNNRSNLEKINFDDINESKSHVQIEGFLRNTFVKKIVMIIII